MKWNYKWPVFTSHRERLAQDDDDTSLDEEAKPPEPSLRVLDWKPVILRSFPLLLLLAVSVTGIGLLQYAVGVLPHATTSHSTSNNGTLMMRELSPGEGSLQLREVGPSGQNITAQATIIPDACTISVTNAHTVSSGIVFETKAVSGRWPAKYRRDSTPAQEACTCSTCVTTTVEPTIFVPVGTVTFTVVETDNPALELRWAQSVTGPGIPINPITTTAPGAFQALGVATLSASSPTTIATNFIPLGAESVTQNPTATTPPSQMPKASFLTVGEFQATEVEGTNVPPHSFVPVSTVQGAASNITTQATTPAICTIAITSIETISSGSATVTSTQYVPAPARGRRDTSGSCTCGTCVTMILQSTVFVPLGTRTVTIINTERSAFVSVGGPTVTGAGQRTDTTTAAGVFQPLTTENPTVHASTSGVPTDALAVGTHTETQTGPESMPLGPFVTQGPFTSTANGAQQAAGSPNFSALSTITGSQGTLSADNASPSGTAIASADHPVSLAPVSIQILPLGDQTFTEASSPNVVSSTLTEATSTSALMPLGQITFTPSLSTSALMPLETVSTSVFATPPSAEVQMGSTTDIPNFSTAAGAMIPVGPTTLFGAPKSPSEKSTQSVTLTSVLYITKSSTTYATATVIGILTPAAPANATKDPSLSQKTDVFSWTLGDVFVSTYLPVLLAVLYKMWWGAVQEKLSLIDPFRQMSRAEGAPANKALFSSYHKNTAILGFFPALAGGRWTLAMTRLAYILALILPAIASEALTVDTWWNCPYIPDSKLNPCPARTSTYLPMVRVLQAFLGVCSVAAIVLLRSLWCSETGLRNNPGSIGAVAELMQHPHVIADIRNLTGKSKVLAQRSLVGKTYILGPYPKGENGSLHYGIRPIGVEDLSQEPVRGSGSPMAADEPLLRHHGLLVAPHQAARARANLIKDAFMVILLIGSFGVILAYELDWQADGFNNFFNSTTIGPRFILVLTSSLIVYHWKRTEHDAVVMAPFTRLSKSPSTYHSTIAYEPTVIPFLSTISAFLNRYYFVGILTLIALLGEALSIVVSGVPASSGQVWVQNQISIVLSLVVLGIMLVGYVLVLRNRKHEPKIPLRPSTLAVKMSYLAESRMLTGMSPEREYLNRESRFVLKEVAWGGKGWRWVVDRADLGVDEGGGRSESP